ncbi:hypothetical protein P389DRAFT_51153 [Cystobasidium minutum MCA 4210]|uniref:uncharacterized protein n=1 Tax=Cystobasidium minutum MCA 4210 TaxID=1397322 RepID=UPI0034CF7BFF|eukprot:jgi/Rhomi1/51153/CE51152_147
MVLHVLGVGAIGSLLAAHLSKHTNEAVKVIVRSGGLYNALAKQNRELTIERDGQQLHTDTIETELIPPVREITEAQAGHPFISEYVIGTHRARDVQRQSLASIDSLFVATKAPAVLPAVQQISPRLSTNSTIVLLQNGGGVVDHLINNLFPDESRRPNFIVGVNTHGAYVRNVRQRTNEGKSSSAMHTVWAGVGSIPFAVMPNLQVQHALRSLDTTNANPLLNPHSADTPSLDYLPLSEPTQSLRKTISAMLACQPLNFEWLALPELLHVQQQKIAVNCVINPLTAIFDVQNGVLLEQNIEVMAYTICQEVSRVFGVKARQDLLAKVESGAPESEDDKYLIEHGLFPVDHPLSPESLHARALQVSRTTDSNVSSTLADIRNGNRSTEIDFLNGYISQLGQELGIPTPVNDSLVQMVHFKTGLGKRAKRPPRGIPAYLPRMRISERFGATYKPQGIKPRHKNRKQAQVESERTVELESGTSEPTTDDGTSSSQIHNP